jgi:hypothetical protein
MKPAQNATVPVILSPSIFYLHIKIRPLFLPGQTQAASFQAKR